MKQFDQQFEAMEEIFWTFFLNQFEAMMQREPQNSLTLLHIWQKKLVHYYSRTDIIFFWIEWLH